MSVHSITREIMRTGRRTGRTARDTPWVWLNAAAVSACILLVLGLLLLIATRGLGHFWPARIHELTVLDEQGGRSSLVGQIRERETVPMERLGDQAATLDGENGLVTRLLVKSGNRDLTGQDFRWILFE